MDVVIITSLAQRSFVGQQVNVCLCQTPLSLRWKQLARVEGRNFKISRVPKALNSLYIMMTEQHYEFHKTYEIVWNLPELSCITFPPSLSEGVNELLCCSSTHVPSCLRLPNLQCHLSDTLIIGNITFSLLKPLQSVFCLTLCLLSGLNVWLTAQVHPGVGLPFT